MVKLRDAGYCNLKLLLLFMVVYGHWIENRIGSSEILLVQYRLIYFVHMPLFAFLSGLFLKNGVDCLRQVKRLLTLYVVLQLAAVLVSGGTVDVWTPFWHLWYLLSYCIWAMAGWLWFQLFGDKSSGIRGHLGLRCFRSRFFGDKSGSIRGHLSVVQKVVMIGSVLTGVLAGVLAGFVPWLNRTMSGSRTVVFFPYFLTGLICRADIPWEKYRRKGIAALAAALVLIAVWGKEIPTSFLYHAEPYGTAVDAAGRAGAIQRLLCYVISGLICFYLLTVIPRRRFIFTKAGADTMPVYLIHAPIVGVLREFPLPWSGCLAGSVLLIYSIYKIFQWRSNLYGIVWKRTSGQVFCNGQKDMIDRNLQKRGGASCGRISGSI